MADVVPEENVPEEILPRGNAPNLRHRGQHNQNLSANDSKVPDIDGLVYEWSD
jgi:hypothetical protein